MSTKACICVCMLKRERERVVDPRLAENDVIHLIRLKVSRQPNMLKAKHNAVQ